MVRDQGSRDQRVHALCATAGRLRNSGRPPSQTAWRLHRLSAPFSGPDPDAILQREDEDLAVADLARGAGPAPLDDRVYGGLDEVLVDRDLQLHFSQQVDADLVAAIELGVPLL